MARIVTGIGTSHGPQLKTPAERWTVRGNADRRSTALAFRGATYSYPELAAARPDFAAECAPAVQARREAACQSAMDDLGRHLEKAEVDVLVIVSSDHKETFDDELLPAFAVFWGDEVAHVPFTAEQLDAMPPGLAEAAHGDVPDHPISRPIASGLARHLVEHSLAAGFDTAASRTLPAGRYRNHGIPHGYGFIYQRILGETSTVPFVPVFVNTFYEPNPPTAPRCVAFGEELAAAIASFPEDLRVGVVASGGLSHFVIDEELDQRFLTALRSGDAPAAFTPGEMVSGSSELRNWIVVAAATAAAGLSLDSLTYEPCYRTEAGTGNAMGFATWGPARGFAPADPAVLARLRGLDACAVSDALDTLGLPGAVVGIGPMWTADGVTAGRVRTVKAAAVSDAGPSTHIASPLVATATAGDVIVIDNAGRVDVSCWGGLLAEAATARGIAGVIVDGACRDVQECEALGLPVHARAAVPVSARGRIVQEAMDVPVQVGGVTVEAGDWVVADRNGLAFVPHDRLDDVVTAAEKIMERERRMGEAVRAGRPVVEVMHDREFS